MKVGDIFFDETSQEFFKSVVDSDNGVRTRTCSDCAAIRDGCNTRICALDSEDGVIFVKATEAEYTEFMRKAVARYAELKMAESNKPTINKPETKRLTTRKLQLSNCCIRK